MAQAAEQLRIADDSAKEKLSARESIERTYTDEIVIALCAPIGTNKATVIRLIEERMKEYGYETEVINIRMDFIEKLSKPLDLRFDGRTTAFSSTIEWIRRGDSMRDEHGASILAELAIQRIALDRNEQAAKGKNPEDLKPTDYQTRRKCYLINSIKNLAELDLLRSIYRDFFYFLSICSNEEERENDLKERNISKEEVELLIQEDAGNKNVNQQEVKKVFQRADFFLRQEREIGEPRLRERIERFLHIIFNSDVVTPSSHETAMYQAAAASRNSACLSRQVGACITDSEGEILSIGWNDVPKFGGGLYHYANGSGLMDQRCLHHNDGKGLCYNDREKNRITSELVQALLKDGLIDAEDQVKAASVLRRSSVGDLLEFSRAVHAEMHAIIMGAQQSADRMRGGILFTTTYPCHNCARHIVVAGISEVYFIEPYDKSLATILHNDSITNREAYAKGDKVKLLAFDGVAPNRFLEFFGMPDNGRKNKAGEGVFKKDLKGVSPKKRLSLQAIHYLEKEVMDTLEAKNLH